jgi:hypothetical protein
MQDVVDGFLLDPGQRFFPRIGELKEALDKALHIERTNLGKMKHLIDNAT